MKSTPQNHAPSSDFNPLATARYYRKLGFAPIPLCSPFTKHTHGPAPCVSPGKVPVAPAWQRFGERQTDADVASLFTKHTGNVGLALGPRQIVIDIDPRNGGEESWAALQQENNDFIDDTPQVYTGGGGQHYYFTLPQGVNVKAGGEIAGYPGVEWKASGGQVVAPPSTHQSGQVYVWEVDSDPTDLAMQPLRPWLIKAISGNAPATSAPAVPRVTTNAHSHNTAGKSTPGYTAQERRAIIAGVYGEGERNAKAISIIGMFISRSVCIEDCKAFMLRWAQSHQMPALDTLETLYQITHAYSLYGTDKDFSRCAHDAHPFLIEALAASNMRLLDNETGEVLSGPEAGKIINLADVRAANLTQEARVMFRASYDIVCALGEKVQSLFDAQLCTMYNVGPYGTKQYIDTASGQPFIAVDASKRTELHDLEHLARLALGEDSKLFQRIAQCGNQACWNCSEHGPDCFMPILCRSAYHSMCASRMAHKISRLDLADLNPDGTEGAYRSTVIASKVLAIAPTREGQADIFKNEVDRITRITRNLSLRQSFKAKVLARSYSVYLDRPQSIIFTRVFCLDDDELREDLEGYLCKRIGNGAVVEASQSYYKGRHAVEQLIYDAMNTFLGIADVNDWDLFGALTQAFGGKHLFQGMSKLWHDLIAIQKLMDAEEHTRPKCSICDKPMFKTVHPAGTTIDDVRELTGFSRREAPVDSQTRFGDDWGPPSQAYNSQH